MFRGSSFHTIDSKGRIVIPSRFRSVLQAGGGEAVVITRHFKCLYGYTLDAWKNVVDRILNAADKNDTVIRFNRFFIGQSQECSLDKQSREKKGGLAGLSAAFVPYVNRYFICLPPD